MPSTWPNAGHFNQAIEDKTTGIPLTGTYIVYQTDGVTQATLYTNRARSSTVSQPLTVNANGNCDFYCDPQEVVIAIASKTVRTDVMPLTSDMLNPPAGTTVTVSTTAPAASASDTGDIFINRTAGTYQAFSAGAWGTVYKFAGNDFDSKPGATVTWTLTDADDGKQYGFGAGTANNITLTVSSAMSKNTSVDILGEGAGTITFVSDGGSVLHALAVPSTTSIKHPGQYGWATVHCRYNPGSAADVTIAGGVA